VPVVVSHLGEPPKDDPDRRRALTVGPGVLATFPPMRFARLPLVFTRPRAGVTIVEVVTALVIVSIGLLGMAGTSAIALRTATTSAGERRALRRLDLRLAALDAAGCARATSGAELVARDSLRERWTVAAATRGAALVDATVRWGEGSRARGITRRSAILC
jgi:Tfp pilus assembly protein PilV